jgi:site-specific recombinase XerC
VAKKHAALPALVDAYLRELGAARGASAHTLRAYRGDLGALLAFLEQRGIDAPEAVTARVLRSFLAAQDEHGLARSSLQRRLSAVRSFFKHLVTLGALPGASRARPAPGARAPPLPHALEVAEIERLLATADVTSARGRRDLALLEFMYSAGTRAAETAGVERADVDSRARRRARARQGQEGAPGAARQPRRARAAGVPGRPRAPAAEPPTPPTPCSSTRAADA